MALDPALLVWRGRDTANDDDPIDLVPAASVKSPGLAHIQIFNRGASDGLFSIDGGKSFQEIPADTAITLDGISITGTVQFKRIPGAGAAAGPTSGRVW